MSNECEARSADRAIIKLTGLLVIRGEPPNLVDVWASGTLSALRRVFGEEATTQMA